MDHLSDEIKILLWASGSNDDVSNCIINDYTNLTNLISFHRLQSRMLQRIKNHKGKLIWLTDQLKLELMILTSKEIENVKKHILVFSELSQKLNSNRINLYLIKGFSTYLLSNYQLSRNMGDIDVFCNNHEHLKKVATELGGVTGSGAGLHEDFYLYDETTDVKVEFHKYFPVFRYPTDVKNNNYNPKENQGYWLQSGSDLGSINQNKIYYNDIKNNSISVQLDKNSRCILMADPNMAVIISCAHIFKDYISNDTKHKYFSTYPKIKLSEIQDVFFLTCLKDFNVKVFEKLVKKFEAYDNIELVHHLMMKYYKYSPFSRLFGVNYISYLNVNITNKLWITEESPFDVINITDFNKRVKSLGYNKIKVSNKNREYLYFYNKKKQDRTITRSIGHTDYENCYPFCISFEKEWEMILLQLVIEDVPEDRWVALKFIFREVEIVYKFFNGEVYEVSKEKVSCIKFTDKGKVYIALQIKSSLFGLENLNEPFSMVLEIATKWIEEYTPVIYPMVIDP